MKNLDEFKKHILSEYPKEACGVIKEDTFYPLPNIAEDPANNFQLSESDTFNLMENLDYKIVHSHTQQLQQTTVNVQNIVLDPRLPSLSDMECQEKTKVEWGIVHCDGKEVSDPLWFGLPSTEPYKDRRYIPLIQDCFSIVRDYYFFELDYDMGTFPREIDWEVNQGHLIRRDYKEEGFIVINSMEELYPHDIVLMSINSIQPNHMCVYLGDDKILHHLYNKLSCIDSLKKWHRHFVRGLRYVPTN